VWGSCRWAALRGGVSRVGKGSQRRSASDLERGQALVLVALALIPLLMAVGLAVDLGMLFSYKARLRRAVDAAALSAAESYHEAADGSQATLAAEQFLAANTLGYSPRITPAVTLTPELSQITVRGTQTVKTNFMSIGPGLATVNLAAEATAVLDSYAEIPIKPAGNFGKVQQVNPSIFGPSGRYSYGDAYSPTSSPDHAKLPYGYLFRIYVPPDYISTTGSHQLAIELFDPDCYNSNTNVSSGHPRQDAYLVLNGIDNGWHLFYRVDEIRGPNGEQAYNMAWITQTRYTLWHFRTDLINLNPFADPTTIATGGTYIAQATYWNDSSTDLKWVTPPGFVIDLNDPRWTRDPTDNSWSFYLYVLSVAGSSENGFDIRTGPPGQNEEADVNDQKNHTWNSGGSMVFARRAYPMNLAEQTNFYVNFTQVPESAAGMTLIIHHFDNDDGTTQIPYYLEDKWGNLVLMATGILSGNGVWGTDDAILIPARGTADYDRFFDSGHRSAWLKALYRANIAQDTSVWELLYIRPRLVR